MAADEHPATMTRRSRKSLPPANWAAARPRGRNGAVRVVVVEDLGLLRQALAALLGAVPDIDVVGQFDSGAPAADATRDLRPDAVVVDVDGSGPDGLSYLRRLWNGHFDCPVLALASSARPGAVRGALDAGVLGILDKDASADDLRRSVRRVASGTRCIDPTLAVAALSMSSSPLTARELTVLRLAADGASAAEIARKLSLSGGTVRNYLSRAVSKTGGRSRIDAVRIAREAAWL